MQTTQLLAGLNGGKFAAELDAELNKLVKQVRDTGKQGAITVNLKVEVAQGADRTLIIKPDVSTNLPKHPRPMAFVFADQENGLHLEDPEQKKLDLKDVDDNTPVAQVTDEKPKVRAINGDK